MGSSNSVISNPAGFGGTWHTIVTYDMRGLETFTYKYSCTDNSFSITRNASGEIQNFWGTFANNKDDVLKISPVYGDGEFTEIIFYTDLENWTIITDPSRNKLRIMSRKSSVCSSEVITLRQIIKSLGFDDTRAKINRRLIDTCATVHKLPSTYPVATVAAPVRPVQTVQTVPTYRPVAQPKVVLPPGVVPIVETETAVLRPGRQITYREPPVLTQVPRSPVMQGCPIPRGGEGASCPIRRPAVTEAAPGATRGAGLSLRRV